MYFTIQISREFHAKFANNSSKTKQILKRMPKSIKAVKNISVNLKVVKSHTLTHLALKSIKVWTIEENKCQKAVMLNKKRQELKSSVNLKQLISKLLFNLVIYQTHIFNLLISFIDVE